MNLLGLALIVIVSSGAIVYISYLFLKKQEQREIKQLQLDLQKERQQHFLPNRLEAFQRVILYLERINPNSLVMRIHNPSLSATAFQSELLKTIREEFDHNVAQQLFISPEGWKLVSNAKEETIKIINVAAQHTQAEDNATKLAEKIFELVAEVGTTPSELAIDHLKGEFQNLL